MSKLGQVYQIKINLSQNHYSKIHDDKAIILCKTMNVKMSKIYFLQGT